MSQKFIKKQNKNSQSLAYGKYYTNLRNAFLYNRHDLLIHMYIYKHKESGSHILLCKPLLY
jgi:hypothetical protein